MTVTISKNNRITLSGPQRKNQNRKPVPNKVIKTFCSLLWHDHSSDSVITEAADVKYSLLDTLSKVY